MTDAEISDLVVRLLCFWSVGFFGGIILTLPFHGVKQILDVTADASGEIRGA